MVGRGDRAQGMRKRYANWQRSEGRRSVQLRVGRSTLPRTAQVKLLPSPCESHLMVTRPEASR